MSNDLKNKTAFITGAAHGQGRATALALANEGVNIIAFDIAKPFNTPDTGWDHRVTLKHLRKSVNHWVSGASHSGGCQN